MTVSNIKFNKNPSGGSRADTCGKTKDRQTDMTKPFVTYANAPNKKKSKVVLEKLTVPQLGEKPPLHLYGIQKFITVSPKPVSDPYIRPD